MRHARVLAVVLALLLAASGPPAGATPRPETDAILAAMQQELSRAVSSLRLETLEKPYFVEYAVSDLATFDLTASFGALVESRVDRSRPLRVDVRVGDYDLDNSEFLGRQSSFSWASSGLVLEDDVTALRHDLWYATDTAYKRALEQIAQKRASLRNRVLREPLPDFARAEPQRFSGPNPAAGFDQARWEAVAKRLSAVFREFPAIEESRVVLHALSGSRYLVNSEGTAIRQPWALASLVVSGSTRAPDGMQLWHYAPFHAHDLAQLPEESALTVSVRRMAGELSALASAPVLDRYIGPVLFTGPAAPEVFAQLLAPELSGQRPPLTEDERMAARLPQARLAERLGRRVLPAFFSVVDDPTKGEFSGRSLLGSYRFDDQGVPAQALSLVEKGVLKSFVMSRRPRKEIPASNGHGRSSAYGSPTAEIGNLILEAAPGKDPDELKRDLIESCRAQGMEYGLRIDLLDVPFLSGREETVGRGRGERETITPPVIAYKVYVADGREELVRGLSVSEMSVRTLREITAAGREPVVWSRPYVGRGLGFSSPGPLGIDSLAVSVAAPAVLFDELELRKPEGPQTKPALLPNPAF